METKIFKESDESSTFVLQLEAQALREDLQSARADRERLSQELLRMASALSEERAWAEQLLNKLEPYLEAERNFSRDVR